MEMLGDVLEDKLAALPPAVVADSAHEYARMYAAANALATYHLAFRYDGSTGSATERHRRRHQAHDANALAFLERLLIHLRVLRRTRPDLADAVDAGFEATLLRSNLRKQGVIRRHRLRGIAPAALAHQQPGVN